jgi:hypothetical protein
MPESAIHITNRFARAFRSSIPLIVLIMAFTSGYIRASDALAQADTTAREQSGSDTRARMLIERLSLTEEQAAEIATILEEHARKKEELEKKYDGNDETDRLSLMIESRRLEQDTEERISLVLDEEQMKRYDEYRAEAESLEKREQAKAYASANPAFGQLAERLALSDEQAAEVFPILEDSFRQMRELMTEARGQGRQGMNAMRDRMDELNATTENRLSRILDERQMAEYKKHVEQQRARMRNGKREGMPGD